MSGSGDRQQRPSRDSRTSWRSRSALSAVAGPWSNDYLSHVHWQSGGACYWFGYAPDNQYVSPGGTYVDHAKVLHLVDGNGGGRFYGTGSNMGEGSSWNNTGMAWWKVNSATVSPMIFYGLNMEPIESSPVMPYAFQMVNSSNVLVLNTKREQVTPTMLISGCSNCAFVGSSRLGAYGNSQTDVESSSNIWCAHHWPYGDTLNTSSDIIHDVTSGAALINPNQLSHYEVGTFDMTAMAMAGT